MLAQKGAGALVHAKQYDYVVFMQDVVLYNFIVLLGMIMIEYGLCLLVLEKLQRNKRKTLVCHEHIDTTERMVQPFYFSEGLFKIGSEGQRSVYLMFVERKLSVAERIEYRKRKSIRTETDG